MPYIDYEYYTHDYKGVPIEEDAFSILVDRSSDLIDQLTNDRIQVSGIDSLHPRIKEKVKKATAAQVEYLQLNGGVEFVHGGDDITSIKVGNFSYDKGAKQGWDNKSAGSSSAIKSLSGVALGYLRGTGLFYSAVSVRG